MYGFVEEWEKKVAYLVIPMLDPYFTEKNYIQKNTIKH